MSALASAHTADDLPKDCDGGDETKHVRVANVSAITPSRGSVNADAAAKCRWLFRTHMPAAMQLSDLVTCGTSAQSQLKLPNNQRQVAADTNAQQLLVLDSGPAVLQAVYHMALPHTWTRECLSPTRMKFCTSCQSGRAPHPRPVDVAGDGDMGSIRQQDQTDTFSYLTTERLEALAERGSCMTAPIPGPLPLQAVFAISSCLLRLPMAFPRPQRFILTETQSKTPNPRKHSSATCVKWLSSLTFCKLKFISIRVGVAF